jgi:Tesmin/TSO1-like CXC domain, cysteine-rich domain
MMSTHDSVSDALLLVPEHSEDKLRPNGADALASNGDSASVVDAVATAAQEYAVASKRRKVDTTDPTPDGNNAHADSPSNGEAVALADDAAEPASETSAEPVTAATQGNDEAEIEQRGSGVVSIPIPLSKLPYMPIPARTIGGASDHFADTQLATFTRCECKGQLSCLRLYCMCFGAGLLCNDSCNCCLPISNTNAPKSNLHCGNSPRSAFPVPRSNHVTEQLTKQKTAFRLLSTTAQSVLNYAETEYQTALQEQSFKRPHPIASAMKTSPPRRIATTKCSCRKSKCLKVRTFEGFILFDCWHVCSGCLVLFTALHPTLQAYCECFYAGTYCDAACRCAGCNNRLNDLEGIAARELRYVGVSAELEKRGKVESRQESGIVVAPGGPLAETTTGDQSHDYYRFLRIPNFELHGLKPPIRAGLGFGRPPPTTELATQDKVPPNHKSRLSETGEDALTNKRRVGETDLEYRWREETEHMESFFGVLKRVLQEKKVSQQRSQEFKVVHELLQNPADIKKSSSPRRNNPHGTMEDSAKEVLEITISDLQDVAKVVELAEVDIMTRMRTEKYPSRRSHDSVTSVSSSRADELGAPTVEDSLLCLESLSDSATTQTHSDAALKELTILAAQDTAILRETARILRRRARELCENRLKGFTNQ